jgi:hypothetical protein
MNIEYIMQKKKEHQNKLSKLIDNLIKKIYDEFNKNYNSNNNCQYISISNFVDNNDEFNFSDNYWVNCIYSTYHDYNTLMYKATRDKLNNVMSININNIFHKIKTSSEMEITPFIVLKIDKNALSLYDGDGEILEHAYNYMKIGFEFKNDKRIKIIKDKQSTEIRDYYYIILFYDVLNNNNFTYKNHENILNYDFPYDLG